MSKTILILVDGSGRPIVVDGQVIYYSSPGDGPDRAMCFTTDPAEAWHLAPIWAERFLATEHIRLAPLLISDEA